MSDLCNPELLEKIAAGDATPAERAELDAHAIECATCARELAWQRREHALFAARRTRTSAPSWKDVEARIAVPAPRRQASWMAGLVAAAAAILLLVKSVPMALHHAEPPVVVVPAAALPEGPKSHAAEKRWQMPVHDGMRVVAYNMEGTISVSSVDRSDVLVTADHWPDLENAGWQIVVAQVGNTLSVRADCAHTCKAHPSVDVALVLPRARKLTVDVDSLSADVEIDHVGVGVTAHTVSGEIHADASALVRARSTSGDIVVEHAPSAALELETISGDVSWAGHCHRGCNIHVQAISGDVQVVPDEGSAYETAMVFGDARPEVRRKGGPGIIGVATVSGDIEVRDVEHAHAESRLVVGGFTSIEPSGDLVAKADISVDDVAKIHVGEAVEVETDSGLPSTRGVVVAIAKEDVQRGTREVKVRLPKGWASLGISVLCRFGVETKDDVISIGSPSGGLVRSVEAHVGDEVHKEQVLVRFDTTTADAELEADDDEIKDMRRAYDQMEMLFKAGAATAVQVAQAKSAIALAKAKRAATEQRLAMATVRSLAHGYVTRVLVHPGQTVAPMSPVVTIAAKK